jgi:HEAT repeat protein
MSVDMAFQIMDKQRGNREYPLENLLAELVDLRILSPVGDDSIRFTYPGLQAWFAAKALCSMPEQMAVLDDITATLGRLSRIRWWDDTLVLLAGRIDDPDSLLRLILYGSRITEGHQIFLAARCIHEAGSPKISEEVRRQVVNTLIWLTSYANEQRAICRQQAIRALGQLKEVTAIPHLVKLILERVRTNWLGNPAFEYSSVRLTAIETLRNMVADTSQYVAEHYPQFTPLLECWSRQDVPALREHLISAPPEHQTIAAFVLGDIGSRPAAEILLEVFQQPDVEPETRWAITDALLRMEPALVTHNAILPFIDSGAAKNARIPEESWKKRKHWYDRIAYLIGNINPKDPKAEAFLARCLFNYTGVWLKSRAIRAIGKIGDSRYKNLLEELATGDFSNIAINKLRNDDITYLRSIAIDSLGSIGDQRTLSLLQQQNDGSNPELQKAYHLTSEEITWRLFERSHFFTTITSVTKYP